MILLLLHFGVLPILKQTYPILYVIHSPPIREQLQLYTSLLIGGNLTLKYTWLNLDGLHQLSSKLHLYSTYIYQGLIAYYQLHSPTYIVLLINYNSIYIPIQVSTHLSSTPLLRY
jgi:hypothetical protein